MRNYSTFDILRLIPKYNKFKNPICILFIDTDVKSEPILISFDTMKEMQDYFKDKFKLHKGGFKFDESKCLFIRGTRMAYVHEHYFDEVLKFYTEK